MEDLIFVACAVPHKETRVVRLRGLGSELWGLIHKNNARRVKKNSFSGKAQGIL